jgi:hypothetical protein
MADVKDVSWAKTARAGDYLVYYADDESLPDMGSRCGRSDSELDEVRRVLRTRGLRLEADDRGLRACDPWKAVES